jgi:formamidopyrimidine-DNA glycosylase
MLRGEPVAIKEGESPRFLILAFHFNGDEGFAVTYLQKQAIPTPQPKPVAAPDYSNFRRHSIKN